MAERTLNVMQVGAMLVSTSCGIGFLLGTGELAMHQGMAGCLYAVATALGLIFLGVCAPALWLSGKSVWSQFDDRQGPSVGRNVALLSLVWMTGVLAAQIRGASEVLVLTGLSPTIAMLLVIISVIALSSVGLSWLSTTFAFCLFACNLALVHSLLRTGGLNIWLKAPVTFAKAIEQSTLPHTGFVLLSVSVMVVCGADYQQFAISARKPLTARIGCLLAAACVFAAGFLPASAVIAAGSARHWPGVSDPVQVIPVLVAESLPGGTVGAARDLVIVILAMTALGSASAILRAMSEATAKLGPPSIAKPVRSRVIPVFLGALVACRPQSLVDMMVDLNVVYIAAVCPLLALNALHVRISDGAAKAAMATACIISVVGYLVRWAALFPVPEAIPLIVSVPAAFAVAVSYRPRLGTQPKRNPPSAGRAHVGPRGRTSTENSSAYSGDADGA